MVWYCVAELVCSPKGYYISFFNLILFYFLQSSACSLPHLVFLIFLGFFLMPLYSNCLFALSLSFLSFLFSPLLFFYFASLPFLYNCLHFLLSYSWVHTQLHHKPHTKQNKTLHHMLTPLQQGTFISNNSCSLWILRPFQVWWEPTWTLRETRMARQPPNPLSSRSPPPQVTHPEELNIGEFRRVPSRSPHRVLRIRVSHFTSVAAAVLFVCLRLCQEDSRPPKLTHLLFLIISDFVHFCHIAFFPPVECLILF